MTADLVRGMALTAIAYVLLAPLADVVHRALDDRFAAVARHRRRRRGERRRRRGVEAVSRDGRRAVVLRQRAGRGPLLSLSPMTSAPASAVAPVPANAPELPFRVRVAVFMRLLAIQGSWNYESLLGNGIGFCLEPALRGLPGGVHSPAFHQALARESRYFNAHPYLAVGRRGRARASGIGRRRPGAHRALSNGALRTAGQRRRPARVGGLAAVLFTRVARGVRTGREPAGRGGAVSDSLQRRTPRTCASGGSTPGGTTGFASRRRSAIRCCDRGRSRSAVSRRSRPASRFRWRSGASSGRGAACWGRCWSQSRWDRF